MVESIKDKEEVMLDKPPENVYYRELTKEGGFEYEKNIKYSYRFRCYVTTK